MPANRKPHLAVLIKAEGALAGPMSKAPSFDILIFFFNKSCQIHKNKMAKMEDNFGTSNQLNLQYCRDV